MKATGVIRRIDDLGRIVIPKEIRKNLRIKNGENLEVFVDEKENIILKKYNQLDKLKDLSEELSFSINSITKKTVLITNTEEVISVSGINKKDYNNNPLSEKVLNIISTRKQTFNPELTRINITDKEEEISYIITPIIANGDLIGSIIMLSNDTPLTKNDELISKIVASFLQTHIEG